LFHKALKIIKWFQLHKSGVNLTILTSSGMGDRMVHIHKDVPGVFLTACAESQDNVKALKTNDSMGLIDPWTYAIVRVIKDLVSK
jgi:hypothetical protein